MSSQIMTQDLVVSTVTDRPCITFICVNYTLVILLTFQCAMDEIFLYEKIHLN